MSVAGSIESITWKKRVFPIAQDSDASVNLGGASIEFQANGDGATGRPVKSVNGWYVNGLAVAVDDMRGDQEFLQDGADSLKPETFTITFASGATYQGVGYPLGNIEASTQSGTASVNFGGAGKLTKQ